jgi:glutamate synthase domain-containing protein 2
MVILKTVPSNKSLLSESIDYLTSAKEIQIKMAQGANSEGGQLPGPKSTDS